MLARNLLDSSIASLQQEPDEFREAAAYFLARTIVEALMQIENLRPRMMPYRDGRATPFVAGGPNLASVSSAAAQVRDCATSGECSDTSLVHSHLVSAFSSPECILVSLLLRAHEK